jgi:hypothetical protein
MYSYLAREAPASHNKKPPSVFTPITSIFQCLDSPFGGGGPRPPHFSTLHDHTFRHTTLGRTPLDE